MKMTFMWGCGMGCLPIHLTLPVEVQPCDHPGHRGTIASTERGQDLLRLGVRAHMAGVHGC